MNGATEATMANWKAKLDVSDLFENEELRFVAAKVNS